MFQPARISANQKIPYLSVVLIEKKAVVPQKRGNRLGKFVGSILQRFERVELQDFLLDLANQPRAGVAMLFSDLKPVKLCTEKFLWITYVLPFNSTRDISET